MAALANLAGLLASLVRTSFARRRRGPLRPGWSLFVEALVAHVRRAIDALASCDPAAQRASFEAMVLPSPVLRRVRREPSEAPRGEWLVPQRGPHQATMLYFHGGGYVTGSLRGYRELCARLALEAGARVFVLEYRLAPEHPFPAALDDALAAARALLAQGPLVLAGDSAGAGLCLSTLAALRDAGGPQALGAVLICPWMDLEMRSDSITRNAPFEMAPVLLMHRWAEWYLGGHDPRDPRASPLHMDPRGLPPLLLQIGGAEVLHDEGQAFAARAKEAGVQVRVEVEPDMPHDWHLLAGLLAQGRRSIASAGAFVREVTAAAPRVDSTGARLSG